MLVAVCVLLEAGNGVENVVGTTLTLAPSVQDELSQLGLPVPWAQSTLVMGRPF